MDRRDETPRHSRGLAGTNGREIGAEIELSSSGPAKKADGESKALKLPGNGLHRLFSLLAQRVCHFQRCQSVFYSDFAK